MHPVTRNALIAAFASALVRSVSHAQTFSPCGVTTTGPPIYPSYSMANTAFSATIQTTHDQKLADGNAVHGVVVTHYYRDSSGRTRGETSVLCGFGLDGKLRPTISVVINDPTNHTTMSWRIDGQDKIAHVVHQDEHTLATTPPPAPPPLTPEQRALNAVILQHRMKNNHTEKFSDSNIAGLACEHTRTTTTTPAGEQGNELPMESTEELCIARGIGLVMLHISDSPLYGRTETKVTDFNSGEPDPSVFAPPPGYTVEEQPVRTANAVFP
jgi:hypothetical protein